MIARVNSLTKEITFTSGPYPSATGDDTVQRLNFVMDRYSGNGTDLSSGDIYIYYTNGRGVTYSHPIMHPSLSDDGLFINFTWDFAREVAEYSIPARFSVCSKVIDGQVITNEWNSEIATLPIIRSIGHREVVGPDSSTYDEFEEVVHEVRELERNIENIQNQTKQYSEIAEAWARGTIDGEPVEEGDYGYNDNGAYYLEQNRLVLEEAILFLEEARSYLPESIPNSDIDAIVDGTSEEEEEVVDG